MNRINRLICNDLFARTTVLSSTLCFYPTNKADPFSLILNFRRQKCQEIYYNMPNKELNQNLIHEDMKAYLMNEQRMNQI